MVLRQARRRETEREKKIIAISDRNNNSLR